MENLDYCKEEILSLIDKALLGIDFLKNQYNAFFVIGDVFTSEDGGKTRINRQIFNENHENIVQKIHELDSMFDEALAHIKIKLKDILSVIEGFSKIDLINLVFDDKTFLENLEKDLSKQIISNEAKKGIVNSVKILLRYKNRIFNYKHYLEMINTTIFERNLNKLGVEDLINSTIIFETIDSYALQFEELNKFELELRNFEGSSTKLNGLYFLDSVFELHKRRMDNFTYANVKYKIYVDYHNDVELNKPLIRNTSYLENIVSSLIEQSCMDLVKKELKKGKIQKNVGIIVQKNKGHIQIAIKNNGFEVKNIDSLFVSDIENINILEARNLTLMIDGKLEVNSIENEGMLYILTL